MPTSPMPLRLKRPVVHLVYLDDSGPHRSSPLCIMGAALVPDSSFQLIDSVLAMTAMIYDLQSISEFEFHAADMYYQKAPFENVERSKTLNCFDLIVGVVEQAKIPIGYGAIDKKKLSNAWFASVNPLCASFRLCALGAEQWLSKQKPPQDLGIFIMDDTEERSNKVALLREFRELRKPTKLENASESPSQPVLTIERGRLQHVHDDMYFGESRFSAGLQIADICSFIIYRHLKGVDKDTAHLYRRIEQHLFCESVEPK